MKVAKLVEKLITEKSELIYENKCLKKETIFLKSEYKDVVEKLEFENKTIKQELKETKKEPSSYTERLEIELEELSKKHRKLCDFMYSLKYRELEPVEQGFLMVQVRVMQNYIDVLEQRIG